MRVRWNRRVAFAVTIGVGLWVLARAQAQEEQGWSQAAVLTREGMPEDDTFGMSIACAGNSILVGASRDAASASKAGAVYVFSADDWSQRQRLIPSDAETNGAFGSHLDADGTHAIAGTSRLEDGNVYFFEQENGVWNETQIVMPNGSAEIDYFGGTVAIQGDVALVAAPKEDQDTGAVYFYSRVDGVWTQRQRIAASDAEQSDFFGLSLAVDGDTAAIGAPGNLVYPDERAAVYLFALQDGMFVEQARITHHGEGGPPEGAFGSTLALEGNTLLVSARSGDTDTATYGVQEFRHADGAWSWETTLAVPEEGRVGTPHLENGRAYLGATTEDVRSVYEFVRQGDGWSSGRKVTSNDEAARGGALAVCGGTLLLGTSGNEKEGGVHVHRNPALVESTASLGDEGGCSIHSAPTSNGLPLVWSVTVALLMLRRRAGQRPQPK